MMCRWQQIESENGRYRHRCERCGDETAWTKYPAERTKGGECEAWPHWWEVGHWAADLLAVFGINQRRFNSIRRRLGFTHGCGCGERIRLLNASGGWLKDRLDVLSAITGWPRLKQSPSPRQLLPPSR